MPNNVQINAHGWPGRPFKGKAAIFNERLTNKKQYKMKLIDEDSLFQYYSDFFQGVEITFRRNKRTGEIMILFTDEIVQKLFKFESLEKMLSPV